MLKVLIIDDERPVCRALERLFFDFAEVDAVSVMTKALKLLEEHVYDAILCDINMPGVTGIDLFHRLADQKPGEEQKVIFLTGGLFTRECAEFVHKTDNHVVYKPFERDELVSLIEEVSEKD